MAKGRSILLAAVFLAAIWWLLSGGSGQGWLVGVPTVGFAAFFAWRLQSFPGGRFYWTALLRLITLFFRESIRGGFTVALRVMSPQLSVRPALEDYHSALQRPAARVLFMICVNLLPGTLIARHKGAGFTVHLLDYDAGSREDMRTLEAAIARVFDDRRRTEESK